MYKRGRDNHMSTDADTTCRQWSPVAALRVGSTHQCLDVPALCFRTDLLDEFFRQLVERMLCRRQTLLIPVFLFVINLVSPLHSTSITGNAEIVDLLSAQRIAHELGSGRDNGRFVVKLQHEYGLQWSYFGRGRCA